MFVRPFIDGEAHHRATPTGYPDLIALNRAFESPAVLMLLQEGDQGAEQSRHLTHQFPEPCPHERARQCTAGARRPALFITDRVPSGPAQECGRRVNYCDLVACLKIDRSRAVGDERR
jgi:hypothetical protein